MNSKPAATPVVRPAKLEDLPELTLLVDHFVRSNRLLPRTVDELQELLPHGFVAIIDDSIVGFAALEIYSPKLAEIRSLAVVDHVQGLGVGRMLVSECVRMAQSRNVLEVMAVTSSEGFFVACGFDFTLPGEKKALFIRTRDTSGNASTLVLARKPGRRVMGFELSQEDPKAGAERLDATTADDALTGASEPTVFGKQTPEKLPLPAFAGSALTVDPTVTGPECSSNGHTTSRPTETDSPAQPSVAVSSESRQPGSIETTVTTTKPLAADCVSANSPESLPLSRRLFEILSETIAAAFENTHDGWAVDRVLTDPKLQEVFYEECLRLGLPLSQKETCLRLLKLRKRGGVLKGSKRHSVSGEECDPYLHACEIAWALMEARYPKISLEEILSDPERAAEFDSIAKGFAPGFTSLEYRWGALRLRKSLKKARDKGRTIKPPRRLRIESRFGGFQSDPVAAARGIYLVYRGDECVYVGGTINLQQRLVQITRKPSDQWAAKRRQLKVKYFTTPHGETDLLAWVSAIVSAEPSAPRFNLTDLHWEHGT